MTDRPLHRNAALASDDHNNGLQLHTGTVTAIEEVSEHLCRITLTAPQVAVDPTWSIPNVAVRLQIGGGDDALTRVYTIRSCSVEDATVDIDVVRHGHASPMMRWLGALETGHTVDFVGPRPNFVIPSAQGRPAALFADDSALPALYAILQQPPTGLHGVAWVATDDHVAFADLPDLPGLQLRRIAAGHGFSAALAGLDAADGMVVWAAGERDDMREIRRHFRTACALPKDDVAVFGYWKRGTSTTAIDEVRLRAYRQLLAEGGTLSDLDDLALEI